MAHRGRSVSHASTHRYVKVLFYDNGTMQERYHFPLLFLFHNIDFSILQKSVRGKEAKDELENDHVSPEPSAPPAEDEAGEKAEVDHKDSEKM